MNIVAAVVAANGMLACSHAKPHVASLASDSPPIRAAEPEDFDDVIAAPNLPMSPNVAVSSEVARRCALHFDDKPEAPRFDFDRFALLPADRDVLAQVAACITIGPLAGGSVALVGRADSRGTEEYNLGLGMHRAESVRDYLERLGVADRQLRESTRGALDATGADEVGWRSDRRVDLELVAM